MTREAVGIVDITIIVKALNEERHIEACLQSALQALQSMPGLTGEVILADSVSTDRTVEIASNLGVRIVQFSSVGDRGCGAALQLGYQYALGRYVYVLDGDMQLIAEFLQQSYAYLEAHPDVAGVGGKLVDVHIRTAADRHRSVYYGNLKGELEVHSLGGGGLYRRSAIDRVGYLAHRWLPAFEEAELAVRLRAEGYRLIRLSSPAVLHSGHAETTPQMMRRLWRSGRIDAIGMFIRSSYGRPWFKETIKACWFAFAAPVLYLLSIALVVAGLALGLPWQVTASLPLALWGGVLVLLAWRKRSVQSALVGALTWHVYATGALRGFFKGISDPARPIKAVELSNVAQIK